MLKISDLHVYYGGIHALKGISLEAPKGKVVTLIGANGAGKSSTLRAISGLIKNKKGKITYNDRDITTLDPVEIVKSGIVMSPEGRRIFPHLSVTENLYLGAYSRSDKDGIEKDKEWVFDLFPRMRERQNQKGGTLSGGEQQMLAIGRAVMACPKLLLLDEPSLGLAPLLVEEIFDIVRRINKTEGVSVLLVEQNARMALSLADYGYIMENGRIVMDGNGEDLLRNPDVQEFYLGLGHGGEKRSYHDVKHYRRRKRWLG